jgi:hypothetical protein
MRALLAVLVVAAVAVAQCPLRLTPAEACQEGSARCALYVDSDGDQRCDNPGPQPVIDPEPEPEDTLVVNPPDGPDSVDPVVEETPSDPEPLIEEVVQTSEEEAVEADLDTLVADTSVAVVEQAVFAGCPLGLLPAEACSTASPRCALFLDEDGNGRCDNPGDPGEERDSTVVAAIVPGCPLGLPPEAACPGDLALCPHWFGQSTLVQCSNPTAGSRRIYIALIALSVLMVLSTYLSRRLRGRKLAERLRRSIAHKTVHGLSLITLGFGIQGCFCPLGAFQYAFLKDGLVFLGWAGIALLLIPFLFASFFGRIFCCWVCPMGAMQELAYHIPSPGKLNPRGRVSRLIGRLRFVVLGGLVTVLLLNRFGVLATPWPAVFCRLDPFHTIFTLFLSGSVIVAGVTLLLSVFVRRFFCRYLCFLGAALSLFAPLRIYSRLTGRKQVKTNCEL